MEDVVEQVEKSAASVEEAIESALAELGLSEQEARIEILQEPKSGFLGIASQPAVVRVSRRDPEGGLEAEEQGELVAGFIEGLLDAMDLDAEVEVAPHEGTTYVEVWGSDKDDMGLLIGKGGHTLEALQELVKSYIHRNRQERCRVLVDVEDYRKRRRTRLVRQVREAAQRVRKTGRPQALQPMSAYERKIVHDTVAALEGLETVSEGPEPQRRVVIRRRRAESPRGSG